MGLPIVKYWKKITCGFMIKSDGGDVGEPNLPNVKKKKKKACLCIFKNDGSSNHRSYLFSFLWIHLNEWWNSFLFKWQFYYISKIICFADIYYEKFSCQFWMCEIQWFSKLVMEVCNQNIWKSLVFTCSTEWLPDIQKVLSKHWRVGCTDRWWRFSTSA